MKRFRLYIILGGLVVLYVAVAIVGDRQTDWTVTLQKEDTNPYGAYITFRMLGELFPRVVVTAEQLPAYNLLSDTSLRGTAYLVIGPGADLESEDVRQMLRYVSRGNDVFISAYSLSNMLADSLGVKLAVSAVSTLRADSTGVRLTNRRLGAGTVYAFRKWTSSGIFDAVDTAKTEVLGTSSDGKPDFVRVRHGKGFVFLHAVPVCFSNDFMLSPKNHRYTAAALSYLPAGTTHLYWDEYYQLGPAYRGGLMRFLLTHLYLRWAWWLALFALIAYVFFESKRRQRVVPVREPLKNNSLDFITTVGGLYFERHDNKGIAEKKITHFLEWVRGRLYLSTERLDEDFVLALARKSGSSERAARDVVGMIIQVRSSNTVGDALLMQLAGHVDAFYRQDEMS